MYEFTEFTKSIGIVTEDLTINQEKIDSADQKDMLMFFEKRRAFFQSCCNSILSNSYILREYSAFIIRMKAEIDIIENIEFAEKIRTLDINTELLLDFENIIDDSKVEKLSENKKIIIEQREVIIDAIRYLKG